MEREVIIQPNELLLPKKEKFEITKDDLKLITTYSNILNSKSYEIIDSFGGIKGLCSILGVNPRIGLTSEEFTPSRSNLLTPRQKAFGIFNPEQNIPQTKSFLRCFFDFLYQKMLIFLLLLATFKLIFNQVYQNGNHFDYISLYILVFVISISSAFSNYIFEKLFRGYFIKINKREVRVLRNQTEKIVPRSQIMVGDIVIVASGDITAVDGIVLKTSVLNIENPLGIFQQFSNLNFVSNQLTKEFPILIHGTKIIKGYALLLVLNVECYDSYESLISNIDQQNDLLRKKSSSKIDKKICDEQESLISKKKERKYTLNESLLYEDYTEIERKTMSQTEGEKILQSAQFFNYSTPLMKNISSLYSHLFYFGLFSSALSTILYFITTLIKRDVMQPHYEMGYFSCIIDILYHFMVLLILVIPSGGELSLSLSVIFIMKKLLKQKTIIKSNATYEYLAGINCIFLDYYGIITENKMEIDNIFIEGGQVTSSQLPNLKELVNEEMFEFFCESIAINSVAFTAEKNSELKFFGNNIECCLIKYLRSLQINYQKYRTNIHREIIYSSPYISDRNFSFTIIKMEDKWEYVRAYIKGTSEKLLNKITSFIGPGNALEDFDNVMYDKIKINCQIMEENFIQPVVVCYKDIPISQYKESETYPSNLLLTDLNLICVIGIKDEIKHDIKDIIQTIKKAGINLKLISGEDINSSTLIAKHINLIEESHKELGTSRMNSIIKYIDSDYSRQNSSKKIKEHHKKKNKSNNVLNAGEDLARTVSLSFNQETNKFTFSIKNYNKFKKTIDKTAVIANATSKDKFILVSTLRKRGICVAVVGDGISDSISMKTANIGISMGKNSNDISKDSAKIIVLDNNLSNLIDSIVYGRSIYDNIRKFFQFQISSILSIVLFIIILSTPIYGIKINHNQLLYINLIIDIIESIALVWGNPQKKILLAKSSEEYAVNKGVISQNLLAKIIIQSLLHFLILFSLLELCPIIFIESSKRVISSMIFNLFVYITVFNACISRIYEDGVLYQLSHLNEHFGFIVIQLLIIFIQIIIGNYFPSYMEVVPLTLYQNFISFSFASLIMLQIPISNYLEENQIVIGYREEINTNEEDKVAEEMECVDMEINEEKDELDNSLFKTPKNTSLNLYRMGSSIENSSFRKIDDFLL